MSWVAASCIKSFEREDGKARLFILAREDGLYMFDGQEAIEENGETVWVPSSLRSVGAGGGRPPPATRREANAFPTPIGSYPGLLVGGRLSLSHGTACMASALAISAVSKRPERSEEGTQTVSPFSSIASCPSNM